MAENASNELHFPLVTDFFIFDTYIVHQAKRNCEVLPNFTKISPSYIQVVLPLSKVWQEGCFGFVSAFVHSASVRVVFCKENCSAVVHVVGHIPHLYVHIPTW